MSRTAKAVILYGSDSGPDSPEKRFSERFPPCFFTGMRYEKIVKAAFLARPNRFVARVSLAGEEIAVHVKNTGRCRELLVPGATVYLEDRAGRMASRKLRYDLVAVEKGGLLINMDSQAPNKVATEALRDGTISLPGMAEPEEIRPETVYGGSRFDFYVRDIHGREGFVEVKGVTLEDAGIASFPDAPTLRGVKHLNELVRASESGYMACALFILQMGGMKLFTPNDARHAAFGDALRHAAARGVHILAYECAVTADSLRVTRPVPIKL